MATGGSSDNLALGILLIVAAFLCVAVMSAFGKAAAALPTSVISFFQSFISLVIFLPWVLRSGTSQARTSRLPLHVLRALAGLLSQVLYFWSVKQMSLVAAFLLANAAPLFIPLIALVWQGTPIAPAVLASLGGRLRRSRAHHQASVAELPAGGRPDPHASQ